MRVYKPKFEDLFRKPFGTSTQKITPKNINSKLYFQKGLFFEGARGAYFFPGRARRVFFSRAREARVFLWAREARDFFMRRVLGAWARVFIWAREARRRVQGA